MSGTVRRLGGGMALAALVLLAWACVARAEEKKTLVRAATGANNKGLEVLAGGLALREGEVGGAFGTVRAGRGKRRFSYFAVIKHDLSAETGTSTSEHAKVGIGAGESTQVVGVGDQKLTITYRVKLDAGNAVGKETVTVNGKELNVARGRVLVVDLTATPPQVGQLKVALPAEVPEASKPEAAAALVKRTLADLAKRNRPIRDFIKPAP